MREFYLALIRAGFPSDIAMGLMDNLPNWMPGSVPQFDPINPDNDPFEDED